MGANEDELARISAAGPFHIPELANLRNSLAALAVTMKDVAGSPGWEGLSADAAADRFETLSRQYFDLEELIGDLQDQVDWANRIRAAALADFDALPSAQAPSWVHDTLEAFDFPGLPDPVDLAQGGLALIENFLGGQRDGAAGRILAAYTEALEGPSGTTLQAQQAIGTWTSTAGGDLGDTPGDPAGPGTTGSWTDGGAYQGTGYTGVEYLPPEQYPWPPNDDGTDDDGTDDDDVEIGVDDPSTGVLPGGGGGGTGGGTGSGGLGGGLPGAGIGTAVAGAGALAAARLGAGAMGMAGAAARLGTGGLLGAGSPASAANRSAGTRGGAAGGRGGQGLLGSGGAQGASDKERRRAAGRGLGGPIAPRIDDDDDAVLPVEGARAGGRDAIADASSSLDG